MSICFEIFGSSSKGNCYLIRTTYSNILIDVGFSSKQIIKFLSEKNLNIDDIHGIFITHEHNDHSVGIRGLSKFNHIVFYANKLTANNINEKFNKKINWQIFENDQSFSFRDIKIVAFSLPHDAVDPVGYVFSFDDINGQNQHICIATDLGHTPHGLSRYTDLATLLVLEANYDQHLLDIDSKRPIYIKNRIRGRYGHLSNEAALSFLKKNFSSNWKFVTFAHMSQDCNSVEAIKNLLPKYALPKSFEIKIADPSKTDHEPIFLEKSPPMI